MVSHNTIEGCYRQRMYQLFGEGLVSTEWFDVTEASSERDWNRFPEVRVRFSGFSHDQDEWINVRKAIRERSIPLEASECHKVKVGDLLLCYRANEDHALYSDAHVVRIERQLHDKDNSTCAFVVRFEYDNAEMDHLKQQRTLVSGARSSDVLYWPGYIQNGSFKEDTSKAFRGFYMQKDYKTFPPSVNWDNIGWSTRKLQMDFPTEEAINQADRTTEI